MSGFGLSICSALGVGVGPSLAIVIPLEAATNVVAVFDEPNVADMLRPASLVAGVFEEPNTADILLSASNVHNTITY
jgi:hypothetical protein